MTSPIGKWEDAVADLWRNFDSLNQDEGIRAMRELAASCPVSDGRASFELASMFDAMDYEAEAAAEYRRALEHGLDDARHAQLAVQYGSTLRNLGQLDEAIAVLSAAPTHDSTGTAPLIVLALALPSAGRKDEALRVAIEAQIEFLPQYHRSMREYAAALTDAAPCDDPTHNLEWHPLYPERMHSRGQTLLTNNL